MSASTMQALFGGLGPEWEARESAVPQPAPGQVRVRVRAAALNRADLFMLEGSYNPNTKTSNIYPAGFEFAGVIDALGEGVDGLSVGERVMGVTLGAFAQYAAVDARHVIPVPARMSWTDAASLPIGLATEYDALAQAGFAQGARVLVVGGATSVGLVGVQVAQALGAAQVIATTTSAAKTATLRAFGADVVIDTGTEKLAEAVLAATENAGADIVLDHVGGTLFAAALPATAIGGTVVSIGRLAATEAAIDLDALAFRRLRLLGTTFSIRTPDELAEVCGAVTDAVVPAVRDGRVRAVVDRVFAFEDAKSAAEYMRSNQAVGKIVLSVPDAGADAEAGAS
jgi:NADPH:quinone reductase-like Zn-dependent oxidoreductase